MNDIPYSALKQNERGYDIMLLRDLYDNTFTDIATEYEISPARVVQIYNQMKRKQIRLYVNHIAVVFGHSSASEMQGIYCAAYECYRDLACVSAYLEKRYKNILTEYRNGEPGLPLEFIKNLPPFKHELSKKTIARIIEMREVEKASFVAIAKELRMTQAKARHTYDSFYHRKVLKLIEALQDEVESQKEKDAIWEQYFRGYKTPKMRYDMLTSRLTSTVTEPDNK